MLIIILQSGKRTYVFFRNITEVLRENGEEHTNDKANRVGMLTTEESR